MVNKLISGILKKKDNAPAPAAPAQGGDVPEELPPLAEDFGEPELAQTPQPQPVQPQPQALPEQTPDELPSLGEEPQQESQEPVEEATQDLPDPIKKAQEAKKLSQPLPQGEPPSLAAPSPDDRRDAGFFSSLLSHLESHGGPKDKLLSGDLFSRMSNYWDLKQQEISQGKSLPQEQKLEEELKRGLADLHSLEQKWRVQKMALEEDLKFLHQREREIQGKVQELKRISNELKMFKVVGPPDYFHLHNGIVLKSLHDLIDALEVMDDETFYYHVSKFKNDFSEWIRNAIKDRRLADSVKLARTRGEMIEMLLTKELQTDPVEKASRLNVLPVNYLWLSNGVVIRSLIELTDALKAMDQALFKEHVNEERNDFAAWVKKAIGDSELAQKLEKAQAKKDMVQVLELYL